ncbi:MAG: hypothetical protein IJI16_04495, partial [Atopobiaceae bacterium]|nr:hypothetical protein [Atopobiaceae bacterium]
LRRDGVRRLLLAGLRPGPLHEMPGATARKKDENQLGLDFGTDVSDSIDIGDEELDEDLLED